MDSKFTQPENYGQQENAGLRDAIIYSQSANPALQRLQQRVLERSNHCEVITSYDRMHHRHSRS